MIQRFEPNAWRLARRWAFFSVFIGAGLAAVLYFGESERDTVQLLLWGGGTVAVAFAFHFARDVWLRLWTIEISEDGVRALQGRTERVIKWEEIVALDESHNGDGFTIKWGGEEVRPPQYFAPESLSFALNAYSTPEVLRLVALLQAGVKEHGTLEFTEHGVALPAR